MNFSVGYSHPLPEGVLVREIDVMLEIERHRHIYNLAQVAKDIRAWRASGEVRFNLRPQRVIKRAVVQFAQQW
jgi:hypothetical protein